LFRDDEEVSESESAPKEKSASEEESSDDEQPIPSIRPYSALIQSLTADSAPQAKRRKLNEAQSSNLKREAEVASNDTNDIVDEVEEEEGPETAIDEISNDEDDEEEDASDPFEAHFADPDDNVLSQKIKLIQQNQWDSQRLALPKVGKAVLSVPQTKDKKDSPATAPVSGPSGLKLKRKLAAAISKKRPSFDILEKSISSYMFNYQDILFCERKPTNSESLQQLACLHAVNHVFK
jgi:U3 small nucleolar RNA-associated protein 25